MRNTGKHKEWSKPSLGAVGIHLAIWELSLLGKPHLSGLRGQCAGAIVAQVLPGPGSLAAPPPAHSTLHFSFLEPGTVGNYGLVCVAQGEFLPRQAGAVSDSPPKCSAVPKKHMSEQSEEGDASVSSQWWKANTVQNGDGLGSPEHSQGHLWPRGWLALSSGSCKGTAEGSLVLGVHQQGLLPSHWLRLSSHHPAAPFWPRLSLPFQC